MKNHTWHIEGQNGLEHFITKDEQTYTIQVRTRNKAADLHFSTVHSIQEYAYSSFAGSGAEWALSVHKSMPEYKEILPDPVAVDKGSVLHIEIDAKVAEQLILDFAGLKKAVKDLIEKNVKTSDIQVQKVVEHPVHKFDSKNLTFHDGGIVYDYKSFKDLKQKQGPVSGKPSSGVHDTILQLTKLFKGVDKVVENPETGIKNKLYTVVMDLNDHQKWSREDIADWIESLDIDTTMVEGDNNGNSNKDKAPA